jgi:hypothetical protein
LSLLITDHGAERQYRQRRRSHVRLSTAAGGGRALRTSDIGRCRSARAAPLAHLDGTSETDLKQCADKNLGTKFRQRGNPLYLAIQTSREPAIVFATTDVSLRHPNPFRRSLPYEIPHRLRACNSSALQLLAGASLNRCRTVTRLLQTVYSTSVADGNPQAAVAVWRIVGVNDGLADGAPNHPCCRAAIANPTRFAIVPCEAMDSASRTSWAMPPVRGARLPAPRRQPKIRRHVARPFKARGIVDRRHEAQGRDQSDPRDLY